jgi:DNA-binding transcriptional LysR family regulator
VINLDIDSLRTFVTLADNRSFTVTAERVSRTQSTVSAQVKKLEDRLGFPVFERDRRNFAITPRGDALLGYAREVLRVHDEGVQRVVGGMVGGTIRVGVTDYFVPGALPALLMQFRSHFPSARVEVTAGLTGDLLAKKKDGEIDIVIGRRDAAEADSDSKGKRGARTLRREKLYWVATSNDDAAPKLRSKAASIESEVPLALLPHGCGVRAHALRALGQSAKRWYIAYCGQSVLSLQSAIQAGVGIGALTEGSIARGMKVLGKRDGFPSLVDSEIVLYAASSPTKEIEALSDLLVEHFTVSAARS